MDLKPGCSQTGMGRARCSLPQSPSYALLSATLEESLFIDSHLRVDDVVVGRGGEHARPGISPLGVP